MAKEFLSQRNVPYREVDVSRDRQAAYEMVRRTGQRGVPVIAVDDEYIVGFDRPRLERALARAAETRPAEAPSRPQFGAAIADAERVAMQRGSTATAGAYVGRVRPGTPAARAGLAPGDVIVQIDGRPIRTAADVEAALATAAPGTTVRVGYLRGTERCTAEARL